MLSLGISAGCKICPVLFGIFFLCSSFIAGLFYFPIWGSFRSFDGSCRVQTADIGISYRSLNEFRNQEINRRLSPLLARNATSDDPDLIRLIRDMLDPPCSHWRKKTLHPVLKTPQGSVIDDILNKDGGFFVECGALDGERSSNTLYFETKRQWTGLLVEVDPYYYTQLVGKCRSAWSINACLSTTRHVQQMLFMEAMKNNPEVGRMMDPATQQQQKMDARAVLMPCFPLEAILQAINQTHVDYFSLDVEGLELDILNTIPFNKIDIQTLSVEYIHGKNGKKSYPDLMATRGYKVHKQVRTQLGFYAADYIFTKTSVSNSDKQLAKYPKEKL